MQTEDFTFLSQFLKKESGLIIKPEKIYLLESRLMPIARQHDLETIENLIGKLKFEKNADLAKQVIEAMTTNETSFFRDLTPFENLEKTILPYFLKARQTQKTLKIWSAACSSGQEPYSIVMTILEKFPQLADWKIDIVATDLSDDILDQARAGEYSQFEVQRGLPVTMLVKYFQQKDDKWVLSDDIKKRVSFKKLNLLRFPYTLGQFDIVFCRNVLIYFDAELKKNILENIYETLPQDGVLMLGGAETVLGITDMFKGLKGYRGLYTRHDTSFLQLDAA